MAGSPTRLENRPEALEEAGEVFGVRTSSDHVGNLGGTSGCNCINVIRGEARGVDEADIFDDPLELTVYP